MTKVTLTQNGTTVFNADVPFNYMELRMDGWNTVYDSRTAPPPTPIPPVPIPVPPNPTPPVTSAGPFDFPTNEQQLADALNTAASEKRQCQLDPRTRVTITNGITVMQANNGGMPWGVNGNFAQLTWGGAASGDMLTFKNTAANGANRGLIVEKLGLDGNGYSGVPAGTCLHIYAPEGDPGSFYKFVIRDIFTMYGTTGIKLEGAVFEGLCDNVHAENHIGNGMETVSLTTPINSVISNIMIMHANLSRNLGAGLKCEYSTNLMFGSFVLNGLGGVIAPNGLRYAAGNNGENTGQSLFVLGSNGYGSVITANEVSSDSTTVARKYVNGQWVNVGQPCLYLLDTGGATGITQNANHTSYYGTAVPNPMRVVK